MLVGLSMGTTLVTGSAVTSGSPYLLLLSLAGWWAIFGSGGVINYMSNNPSDASPGGALDAYLSAYPSGIADVCSHLEYLCPAQVPIP